MTKRWPTFRYVKSCVFRLGKIESKNPGNFFGKCKISPYSDGLDVYYTKFSWGIVHYSTIWGLFMADLRYRRCLHQNLRRKISYRATIGQWFSPLSHPSWSFLVISPLSWCQPNSPSYRFVWKFRGTPPNPLVAHHVPMTIVSSWGQVHKCWVEPTQSRSSSSSLAQTACMAAAFRMMTLHSTSRKMTTLGGALEVVRNGLNLR